MINYFGCAIITGYDRSYRYAINKRDMVNNLRAYMSDRVELINQVEHDIVSANSKVFKRNSMQCDAILSFALSVGLDLFYCSDTYAAICCGENKSTIAKVLLNDFSYELEIREEVLIMMSDIKMSVMPRRWYESELLKGIPRLAFGACGYRGYRVYGCYPLHPFLSWQMAIASK